MKKLIIIICIASISGCATGYKKYGLTGGYKDSALDDGNIKLDYIGNGSNSIDQVSEFWNRRAVELCPNGFEKVQFEEGGNTTHYPIVSYHPWIKSIIKCEN